MTIRSVAALALLVAAACAPAARRAPSSNAPPPRTFTNISYSGRWEFVKNRTDGRFSGRSARSYHAGDSLTVLYDGEGFQVYGVTGPKGGVGTVVLPGFPSQQISFYSPRLQTHKLVYRSPQVGTGLHTAGIVVTRPQSVARGYVNVDEVQILGRQAYLSLLVPFGSATPNGTIHK